MGRQAGKRVLVTGASSGIGEAACRALLDAGFEVWATARRVEGLADLAAAGCRTVALDVTDEQSMQRAVRTIGAVDVLVNNAGYGQNGVLERLDVALVRAQLETNVVGLLRMTQLVLPGMRAQGGGRVINIGSIGGTFAAPGAGAYHMSKFAVEALTDSLRVEVARFGVDVVLLQPTGVATPFVDRILAGIPALAPEDPYAAVHARMAERITAMFGPEARRSGIIPATDVAAAIVRAATVARPRTRYRVGLGAHVLAWLRALLPDRWFDRVAAAAIS